MPRILVVPAARPLWPVVVLIAVPSLSSLLPAAALPDSLVPRWRSQVAAPLVILQA
ncbi:hypothetical protein [Actinomyces lilanjuaniae]|uniref:hypothetical protein n=1 Tax=Actinomyces lilanjuaniae TaxID=2321394 RepID=UPI0013C47440|nr:hypothetical protein [Actinomyces lilanjuaniae]